MSDNPEATFIICTYNRAAYLDDTLNSILEHTCTEDPIEILVIDNNSTDRTEATVHKYKKKATHSSRTAIRYVKEKKQGLSHARNRGIKEAEAPHIIFLDDDVLVTEQFVPAWLTFFKDHPEANAAGGKIHVQFDDPRPGWLPHFLLPLLGHHDFGDSRKKYRRINYPFGGNMGFKKTVFERVGMFNTELGRKGNQLKASEEKELFHRIKRTGSDIYYLPKALLYHRVNNTRLTKKYIKRQARGLGQSIALQLEQESGLKKLKKGFTETGKIFATAILFVIYSAGFQFQKAVMLVKFRKWIAEGFFDVRKTLISDRTVNRDKTVQQ